MNLFIQILVSLGLKLLTESFVKGIIITCAEAVAARTENDIDNQVVAYVKEAWKD